LFTPSVFLLLLLLLLDHSYNYRYHRRYFTTVRNAFGNLCFDSVQEHNSAITQNHNIYLIPAVNNLHAGLVREIFLNAGAWNLRDLCKLFIVSTCSRAYRVVRIFLYLCGVGISEISSAQVDNRQHKKRYRGATGRTKGREYLHFMTFSNLLVKLCTLYFVKL